LYHKDATYTWKQTILGVNIEVTSVDKEIQYIGLAPGSDAGSGSISGFLASTKPFTDLIGHAYPFYTDAENPSCVCFEFK
jgi:hypothetical protein